MLDRLIVFFEKELQGRRIEPILVGVSGGPDSICLLDLLVRSKREVIAAHFDHQLRDDSSHEAEFVAAVSADYGIPFIHGSGDVKRFAKENSYSLEEAARKARYTFLFSKAREIDARSLAVAHNADDQVETVVMHFTRGAGLSGLKGMTPYTLLPEFDLHIPLIRPILRVWRSEILVYCREHDLKYVQDATNLDQTYFRNYLRHSLIPELESKNPGIKKTIQKSAVSLSGDLELIRGLVDQFWSQVFIREGEGFIAFDLPLMRSSSVPLLRNILRRAVVQLCPASRDLDFNAVERGVSFISLDYTVSATIDLMEGIRVFGIGKTLYVAHKDAIIPLQEWPQIGSPLLISQDETIELGDGWMIRSQLIARDLLPADYSSNHDPHIAWLDAGKVTFPLNIRSRREGDRFKPLGMATGSIKLSDIFINEKIPREVRSRWPLICKDEILIWVPGYRSAHDYRVTGNTCKVLKLLVFKQP